MCSDDGAGRLPGGGFRRHIWRERRAAGVRREGARAVCLAAGGCKEQNGKKKKKKKKDVNTKLVVTANYSKAGNVVNEGLESSRLEDRQT